MSLSMALSRLTISCSPEEAVHLEEEYKTLIKTKQGPFISPLKLLLRLPLDNYRFKFKSPLLGPGTPNWPTTPSLQKLPVELHWSILSLLSIQDITNMRRVSQYHRYVIDGLKEYDELYKFAPSALRACLATNTASSISLLELHHALTHPLCHTCVKYRKFRVPNFGANFNLFSGKRMCTFCLRNRRNGVQPIRMDMLQRIALRHGMVMTSLIPSVQKVLTAVPAIYGMGSCRQIIPRQSLFEWYQVPQGIYQLLSFAEKDELIDCPEETSKNRVSVWHNPLTSDVFEADINLPGGLTLTNPQDGSAYPRTSNALLYTTSIPLPFLDNKTKTSDYGTSCRRCLMVLRYTEWEATRLLASLPPHGSRNQATIDRVRTASDDVNRLRQVTCKLFLPDMLREHERRLHETEVLSPRFKQFIFRMEVRLQMARFSGHDLATVDIAGDPLFMF